MPPHALALRNLTKHYGEVVALAGVDLEVHRGEVFGFLGPNGAGKTTAIRTITDEIRATSGTAQVLGLDSRRDAVAIRSHLGYLPGDLALYPRLTGRETLTFFANLRGGVDWDLVESIARRLDADLDKRVGELSSGNRQKIGLIQAFMNTPDVLIMDEPSTGLDPLVQAEFHAMVREVVQDGRTVFLSSHTLSEVERIADRVGIIRLGELVAVEAVSDLVARAVRRVEFVFRDGAVDAHALGRVAGARNVRVEGRRVTLAFNGNMAELLTVAAANPSPLVDVEANDADLEEIFLTYYRGDTPRRPIRTSA